MRKTMQKHISNRAAALVVLALGLTACGGGGGSSPAPNPGPGATSIPQAGQRETATFTFTIPARTPGGASRTPRYISPSTASIQVTVTGANSSSATAKLDVNATTCPANVCSVGVSAPVGNDTFTITTYDAAGGASGGGAVLSTATQAAAIVLHAANAFNFTLGGVTASVKVSLDDAFLPAGVPGTASATVKVLDAGGNQIIGTYQSPVTLSAADASVSLGKTSFADSTVTSSAVTFSGAARAAVAITATDGTHAGSAALTPTSNTIWIPIRDAQNGDAPFHIVAGPDGKIYYGQLGQTALVSGNFVAAYLPGRIGVVDPATNAVTEYPIGYTRTGAPNVGAGPIKIAFKAGTSDLYIAAQESGSIEKIVNATGGGLAGAAGSNSTTLIDQALAPQPSNGNVTPNTANGDATPRSFAFSGDGSTIYVGTYGGHSIAVVPIGQFGVATPTYVAMPGKSGGFKHPQGLVDLNGNVYFIEQNGGSTSINAVGVMSETNVASAGITEYPDTVIPTGYIAALRHMTSGPDGNLYLTWSGDGTAPTPLHYFNPVSRTFSALASPGTMPFFPDAIQPSNVAGSTSVVFNDLAQLAVGIHDTATHNTTLIPAYTSIAPPMNYPNDAVQTTPNDFWFTGAESTGTDGATYTTPPLVGHIVLAAGWGVFPQLKGTIPINGTGDPNAFLFAVVEQAGGADTFTVTSSVSAICTAAAIPSFPHDYKVVGVGPGNCAVTVTDQNQRAVTLNFQVTTQTATINSKVRKPQ
jgi:hypothetical protein